MSADAIRDLVLAGVDGSNLINLALYWCIEHGRADLTKMALVNGADMDFEGDSSFWRIFEKGYLDVLQVIHEHGIDYRPYSGIVIFISIRHGHLDMARWLVAHGADPNAKINTLDEVPYDGSEIEDLFDTRRMYTMDDCADRGDLEGVKCLVEIGADQNLTEAIMHAYDAGHFSIVEYLAQNGADSFSMNLVMENAVYGNDLRMAEFMLKNGADAKLVGLVHASRRMLKLVKEYYETKN
jgi:ankyrin repeat protein